MLDTVLAPDPTALTNLHLTKVSTDLVLQVADMIVFRTLLEDIRAGKIPTREIKVILADIRAQLVTAIG